MLIVPVNFLVVIPAMIRGSTDAQIRCGLLLEHRREGRATAHKLNVPLPEPLVAGSAFARLPQSYLLVLFHRCSCVYVTGPVKTRIQSASPGCDTAFLNRLSKAIRDSVRRVFSNSTTQDRTPCGDLFRKRGLISHRVAGTLRSAFLMSLIGCIVFRVAIYCAQ